MVEGLTALLAVPVAFAAGDPSRMFAIWLPSVFELSELAPGWSLVHDITLGTHRSVRWLAKEQLLLPPIRAPA